ncbi:DUF2817 domain-containing protein [Maribellus comscasis]|uniref:DUF2817 domain-containing protein n=1 Tax=Maribellus comscasis TaxID=2681766 RepID=A0A6I6JN59_9BACT|nr:M14 family zinc carboxypeptidase [Maribellus comscasis]QGY42498.1 DUF2817 domain-containing protein [Maribellus comscasis]
MKKNLLTKAQKKILIIGIFHGDEPEGEYIINRFIEETDFSTIKNHLYFIPCLNPSGKKLNTRQNKNGVDLNRNYPTKNWVETEKNDYYSGDAPASEEETKFMVETLETIKPDVILTIHAPFKVVNFDGPAKEIAEKVAELCGHPVLEDIGYPTPGSFGTYCGVERNIPTITLELDEEETEEQVYKRTKPVIEYLGNLN